MENEKRMRKKTQKRNFFDALRALTKKAKGIPRYLFSVGEEVSDAFWTVFDRERAAGKPVVEALILALSFFGVFFFAMILSLAKFPLKVYPAGFALLSSLGPLGGKRRREKKKQAVLESTVEICAFCGTLTSCAFLERYGFFYFLSYILLFLIRAGITGGKFNESILSRVTLSAMIATGLGVLLAFLSRFTVNRVFAAISAGLITPILTYLICGIYIYTAVGGEGAMATSRKRVYLEATIFTLEYLFLFSLREITLFGCSLSFVLAVVVTLFASRSRGALYGAAAGMIGGMAAASSVAPALAVGGFFSGLFFEYSGMVAMMVAFVSSCGYSLYTEGFSSFAFFTADYLCGALLFFPFLRMARGGELKTEVIPMGEERGEGVRSLRKKLKSMSDAFSSLSEVFYTVGETMKKPTLTECSRMISDVCCSVCSRCGLSGLCWGEKQALSAHATATAAAKLMATGKVRKEDFEPPFSEKCTKVDYLTEEIARRFEEINGSFYKNNKTTLLAGEYSAVSRLLKSTAGVLDRELEFNPAYEKKAKKVLAALGILYRRVAVFGSRELKIDVYGVALERVSLASETISLAFGKEFDCVFDDPAFLMLEENVVMRLRRKRKISLECAKSGCCKKGEAVSGDSCLIFETDRDLFYTLICDGMGSGREAAFTSRLASIFIEKLMHCATPKNVTLEMLNTFLMAKTDETFTTVDLLEIDLLTAGAKFIKAGAAPSYVLRGDRVHRIESRTPPAGILNRMCAEETSFALMEGDFIIQMSDGASCGKADSAWLVGALTEGECESASALCEKLFSLAGEKGDRSDDLTVSVVHIMNS